MKKQLIIIIIQGMLILGLAGFMLEEYQHYKRMKELFINKIYFLLVDISNDLTTVQDEDDIILNLVILDTVCQTHRLETKGKFYYPDPTIFRRIANSLDDNTYNENELELLTSNIGIMIEKLSNNMGKSENGNLSYEELNAIFQSFYINCE